jgi:hypothetical protein
VPGRVEPHVHDPYKRSFLDVMIALSPMSARAAQIGEIGVCLLDDASFALLDHHVCDQGSPNKVPHGSIKT